MKNQQLLSNNLPDRFLIQSGGGVPDSDVDHVAEAVL